MSLNEYIFTCETLVSNKILFCYRSAAYASYPVYVIPLLIRKLLFTIAIIRKKHESSK